MPTGAPFEAIAIASSKVFCVDSAKEEPDMELSGSVHPGPGIGWSDTDSEGVVGGMAIFARKTTFSKSSSLPSWPSEIAASGSVAEIP
jgi:hypothetical protein